MRACWLKWVGRDWSISADYIWLNYSDANNDNRPVNAILRDLRNMLSPTSAILAGCFAAEGREDDATFAETHCNADALVRMSADGMEPSCARVFG